MRYSIVGLQHFLQADGDGAEVAACQAAVRREASFCASRSSLLQKAGDVRERVGEREHLARDFGRSAVRVARLALFDEPSVPGEAAGIDVEADAVALGDFSMDTDWPPPELFVSGC
jgi:hypothetical protein